MFFDFDLLCFGFLLRGWASVEFKQKSRGGVMYKSAKLGNSISTIPSIDSTDGQQTNFQTSTKKDKVINTKIMNKPE